MADTSIKDNTLRTFKLLNQALDQQLGNNADKLNLGGTQAEAIGSAIGYLGGALTMAIAEVIELRLSEIKAGQ